MCDTSDLKIVCIQLQTCAQKNKLAHEKAAGQVIHTTTKSCIQTLTSVNMRILLRLLMSVASIDQFKDFLLNPLYSQATSGMKILQTEHNEIYKTDLQNFH